MPGGGGDSTVDQHRVWQAMWDDLFGSGASLDAPADARTEGGPGAPPEAGGMPAMGAPVGLNMDPTGEGHESPMEMPGAPDLWRPPTLGAGWAAGLGWPGMPAAVAGAARPARDGGRWGVAALLAGPWEALRPWWPDRLPPGRVVIPPALAAWAAEIAGGLGIDPARLRPDAWWHGAGWPHDPWAWWHQPVAGLDGGIWAVAVRWWAAEAVPAAWGDAPSPAVGRAWAAAARAALEGRRARGPSADETVW
ncbi:MAG: hypothetical protein K6U87_06015 [Firmicutes bacterium]|nr:hypothetical protein [Bacillota bacterium]